MVLWNKDLSRVTTLVLLLTKADLVERKLVQSVKVEQQRRQRASTSLDFLRWGISEQIISSHFQLSASRLPPDTKIIPSFPKNLFNSFCEQPIPLFPQRWNRRGQRLKEREIGVVRVNYWVRNQLSGLHSGTNRIMKSNESVMNTAE